jgi:ribosomal-protein-alanine N-acetyltransferase
MLTTNRLNLRPFTEKDLDLLFSLHANPEVAKTTIDGIQSREQVQKQLDNFIAHNQKFGFSQWAVFEKESGKFIGRGGLTTRTLSDEVGEKTEVRFAFLPEFWGKGYASEVTQALLKFAFEELKFEIIAASNGLTNEKSFRVLTKNGFRFIKNLVPQGYGNSEEIRYFLITCEEFFSK